MVTLGLLQKLGVYVEENFLPETLCAEICSQMEKAVKTEDGLWSDNKSIEYKNSKHRQSHTCHIPEAARIPIEKKVLAAKVKIEKVFDEEYSAVLERPKFLRYSVVSFFAPHTDNQLNRKINISIYLNSQTTNGNSGDYSGGVLNLYNLIESKGWEGRGVPIPGKAGMLIAYPARILHEVTPVTEGFRYAIVSRYLSCESEA
jgi:predicted 2-oxoglutarate/Fe(II)-dependent dioxygenase YbiX